MPEGKIFKFQARHEMEYWIHSFNMQIHIEAFTAVETDAV